MSAGLDSLTAVVISYAQADLTVRCVRALADDGVPLERIVIVDNGSRDDSVERFGAELPRCIVVALPENVGYARAANAGPEALPGDAYLICNNDAFVHRPGSVRTLVAALREDPRRGLVVPRILNEDLTLQPTVRPVDTPLVALARASGLSRLIPNRWQPRWSTHWDHAASADIVAADGPIFLFGRRAWDELGGYNPRIRMFAEDSDICWRTRNLGWRIRFTTEAEFVHLGKATSMHYWSDPARAELVGRSEAALLLEQLGPVSGRLSIGFTAGGLAARWLVFRARRDTFASANVKAALRGYMSASGSTTAGS
jgi:N-acetylglucosaminyl-diphospho-decaprenol L-rhamnosyltransferase